MKPFLIILAATFSAFTAATAQDLPPAAFIKRLEAGEKITIVTMGTSLTGGQWRWPDVMMVGWLNRDYTGQVTLFNEGVGASASSVGPGNNAALSGLGKLPAVLAHKPDVVFIEFAVNDAYLPYKISLEDSKKNLNTLIDGILEANPKTEIILQTMNTVKDKPGQGANGGASQRPKLDDYVDASRQVAKTRSLRLVDHYPNWQKLMRDDPAGFDKLVPDGVHPEAGAHWEMLLPELKHALVPPSEQAAPYLQNPTDSGMTVCLLTRSASAREVLVSLTTDGEPKPAKLAALATAIPDTSWTVWKTRIKGLKPGTTYQYQLHYRSGNETRSTASYHFRTLDPAAKSQRAIAFNDTHTGHGVVAALMDHVKPEDYDFSLLLGDILEGPADHVIETWNQYAELLDGANKPIIYVRGNHDTRGAFAKHLALLFDLPNLDPSKPWGEEQWQYVLHAGPVDFLVLDTCEDDDDSTPKTSYKNPDLWQKVRKSQAAWLKQNLVDGSLKPASWRILLTHMPLYNSPWCSVRSRNLWTPLLSEWKPDLALSGHDHTWRQTQPIPKGGPWPTLVGGGPAKAGGEEGTMMILSADEKSLTVRLIGSKDGRQLTEFTSQRKQ
jgi:acyl-CoA thioesterase-1